MESSAENTNPDQLFFDILKDDLVLILNNSLPVTQTVTLFDSANASTKGSVTSYNYTIPNSEFPASNPKIIIGGVNTTYTGSVTKETFASAISTLTPTAMTYVGSSDTTSYYSIVSAGTVYGNITLSTFYSPTSGTTLGGSSVTITLVNMNYNQFVSGLNMLGGYFFDTIGVYAQTASQVSQQLTLTKFTDVFGKSFVQGITPVLNPFANQPASEGNILFMPADGNNTITYNIVGSERVILKITTRAYDVLKTFDPYMRHIPAYSGNGGKMLLVPTPAYYKDGEINYDTKLVQI